MTKDEWYRQLFERLDNSRFRSSFHLKQKDIDYINEKGLDTIRQHAKDFIAKREAPAYIANDGKQTPMRGHPVFIAQHATATCCRECIRKWHKMQPGKELSQVQQEYLVDVTTISSVTYTGTCFLPSWTAIVCPTKDGKIVERRDQVLITDLSFAAFNASTFLSKLASAKGPFFSERDMLNPPYYFDNAFPSRLLTMSLLDGLFFFLVFRPRAGLPQGVHGPGRPTGARPSPPPCGWSFGFITEPRTVGRIPM